VRAADIEPSGYRPLTGDRFFLLTESSFGSGEIATVRLEAPERWEPLTEYPEADLIIYRVPDPLGFLKTQKNLHRIQVKGDYRGEGLSNALRYVWDSAYKKSRLVWQRIFSPVIRARVVAEAPILKQTPPNSYRTQFENHPQFKPLSGFQQVARFRYPLWAAKPVEPPKGVEIAGSSSEFIASGAGNRLIPLGKLQPGLYLVEAMIGHYRATTLVFVTDTVAITKTAHDQLLVWTADRTTGAPCPAAKILLTDGAGVLESGVTDADGVLIINRPSPERSYVIGADPAGGVFVSENFYYDSEIYAAKLYAFTDRPLYRPGDTVCLKLVGRVFQDSRHSTRLVASGVHLAVLDPNGTPVTTGDFNVIPDAGGDTCFALPEPTASGGYTLQLGYQGAAYTAAFRVAEYVKPHYELAIRFNQKEFKTGEPITGQIKLTYPGGQPVRGAQLELTVRAQPLTMVEDEPRYQGRFPIKLLQNTLTVAEDGSADFNLPPAQTPSRYVLSVISTDGAAYRVTASQEIRIPPGAPAYALTAANRLSRIGEVVAFTATPLGAFTGTPARWEAIRLEDQSQFTGAATGPGFTVRFDRSGSYTVNLKDREGRIAGSLEHWVAGPELTTQPGSIAIVLDQDEYRIGDTAQALITFPVAVDHALITLERDQVEAHGLLPKPPRGIRLTRQNDRQWRADIPVQANDPPNITFSLLYVQNGAYVFQNKGLKVVVPRIRIALVPDKTEYRPGDTVNVEVETTLDGQPIATHLAVSVVDEMVYVLQPEIAPPIHDFFHHIRRNQVRTASSLNFHSYDLALPAVTDEAAPTAYSQRVLKVPDRPRRENMDTAAWLPNLQTDATGKTRFSFVLPDSIARWRLTGRAMAEAGQVGQNTAGLISIQDYYLKWTGPTVFRSGDQPLIDIVAFNQGTTPVAAQFSADGMSAAVSRTLTLQPGANDLEVPIQAAGWGGMVNARLTIADQAVDQIQKWVTVVPGGWPDSHALPITLDQAVNEIKVPADAANLRLSLAGNATDLFLRVADALMDYPFGCVEQTASRLIPLALIYPPLQTAGLPDRTLGRLRQQLSNHRLRLARMAGPESAFGWWGDISEEDPFLTAYAYYADWNALRALGIAAPASHWEKLLTVYQQSVEQESLLRRALMVWLMRQMGLPTKTLTEGLINAARHIPPPVQASLTPEASRIFDAPATALSADLALTLVGELAEAGQLEPELQPRLVQARSRLAANRLPLAQALTLLAQAKTGADSAKAAEILAALGPETATIDRALSLIFIHAALGGWNQPTETGFDPGKNWARRVSKLGVAQWFWQGKPADNVRIALKELPASPLRAYLSYDGYGLEPARLPVTIERRFYQLQRLSPETPAAKDEAQKPASDAAETPAADTATETDADQPTTESASETETAQNDAGESESEGQEEETEETPDEPVFQAIRIAPERSLATSDLYVDEIRIAPAAEGVAYRYGVLEIPLPPGAEVEPTTWGLNITGLGEEPTPVNLSEPVFTTGRRSYSIPVDELTTPQVYQFLVRFSQRGDFGLPPVRYFRMYQPNEKGFETGLAIRRIDVR
jgi:hypothetical protein